MTQKQFIDAITKKVMSTGILHEVGVISEIKIEKYSYESRVRTRYRVHVMASMIGKVPDHKTDFSHCINDAKTLNEVFQFIDEKILNLKAPEHMDIDNEKEEVK